MDIVSTIGFLMGQSSYDSYVRRSGRWFKYVQVKSYIANKRDTKKATHTQTTCIIYLHNVYIQHIHKLLLNMYIICHVYIYIYIHTVYYTTQYSNRKNFLSVSIV